MLLTMNILMIAICAICIWITAEMTLDTHHQQSEAEQARARKLFGLPPLPPTG